MNSFNIGGFTEFSLVDYPEYIACTIFCFGCLYNCPYCYNTHLKDISTQGTISFEDKILPFLEERKNKLEAVVFSGGEPLMQHKLGTAIEKIKEIHNFKIGLHSSGMIPGNFKKVLPMLDWVGLDIKAPFDKYEKITGNRYSGHNAKECFDALLESKTSFEIRTTVDPDALSLEDVQEIIDICNGSVIIPVLQRCFKNGKEQVAPYKDELAGKFLWR